jgi:alanine racemase
MSIHGRRDFLKNFGIGTAVAVSTSVRAAEVAAPSPKKLLNTAAIGDRVGPWIEIDPAALRHNAAVLSAKMAGRPVLPMLKCNAYGLDPAVVAPCLEPVPQVWGFGVVKSEEAFAIRASGAHKPIVMLGDFDTREAAELVRQNIALCTYSSEAGARFVGLAKRMGHPIKIHIKVDAGLGRLGIPYYQAEQWIADLMNTRAVTVDGIFCNLVEVEAANEHLQRFKTLVANLRAKGFNVGIAHAAASYAITHVPDCAMDMIRPGIMIYGVNPDDAPPNFADLQCVHRLRGRVIRTSPLRQGDGVGYDQGFIAQQPGWTATVMCGWSDGYNYKANKGCLVLINGKLYPMIARMANYAVVDLGATATVQEGDIATLVGPEPGVTPNELASKSDGPGSGGYGQIRYNALLSKFLTA